MIKKILAISSIFSLVYIGMYTNIIENIFNCDYVAQDGGLIGYLLLSIIASILILKK